MIDSTSLAPTVRSGPPVGLPDLEREAIQSRISANLFGTAEATIRLGRFRVLETLGRGGMGIVYAAEDDRLGRTVAIKVIREPGSDDGERERLLAEARAQARLSHPNVVQVYEVGETGDDVFVVMELIRGDTLDRWLARRTRTRGEILAVFLAAGRGLAAAHAAGLVHRDIKPGNILIGDDGRVCIADFGLARGIDRESFVDDATNPSSPTNPSVTRPATAGVAGTPAYMAPEQLRGRPGARGDQFSFCVTLFEALVGRRPFTPEQMVDAQPIAPPAMPGAPRWLRRLLARGLAFAPDRRFLDMGALLRELEAGPRRRRRLILAIVALPLVGGLLAAQFAMHARSTCVADDAAFAGIWDPAARDAVETAVVATGAPYAARVWQDLAVGLDVYTARWLTARAAACQRAIGERGEVCLDRARRILAARLTRLRTADLREVASLDAWLGSLPDPDACVDPVRLDAAMLAAPGEARALELDAARLLRTTRGGSAALEKIAEVLQAARADVDAAAAAEALLLRARVEAHDLADSARARETLLHAYDSAVAAGHAVVVWQISNELARIHARDLQDPADAHAWLRRARSEHAALGVHDPLGDADLLDSEAAIAVLEQQFDRVLGLRRRALELRAAELPPYHPDVVAARMQVANALAEQGHTAEALAMFTALHADLAARWGDEHPTTARVAFNTGLTHLELGQGSEARQMLSAARAAFVRQDGESSPRVASADLYLAQLDVAIGAVAEAEARVRGALAYFDEHYPPDYSERLAALALLVELVRSQRRSAEVVAVAGELLALHDAGAALDALPEILNNIGDSLCQLDRCGEAMTAYSRLLAHYQQHPPTDPAQRAYPLQGLGRVNLALGQPALAQPLFEEALRLLRESPEPPPHPTADAARNLARCLAEQGVQPRRQRELQAYAATFDAPAP